MKEFVEKLIGRLEEYKKQWMDADYLDGIDEIIKIVNELAEKYKNESVKWDLISRSALIKTLNEYVTKAYDCGGIDDKNVIEYQQTHNDKSGYIVQGFNEVYELLQGIATDYNNGWIPCSSGEMPKCGEFDVKKVWVTMHRKEVDFYFTQRLKWNNYYKRWEWLNGKKLAEEWEVVAWMYVEVPKPYKEEGV